MSGVNETELKIIGWLASERQRKESQVWAFARDLAEGDESEWGDRELNDWLAGLLNGSASATLRLEELGADIDAAYDLIRRLEAGTDTTEWLEDLDLTAIRVFLLQVNPNDDLYVHALVGPFHPNNRYRVDTPGFVYEAGWYTAGGRWGLPAADRQICPEPISRPCSCRVEQREAGS